MLAEGEPPRATDDREMIAAIACVPREQRADVHVVDYRSMRKPRNAIVPISGKLIISMCFSPKPHLRSCVNTSVRPDAIQPLIAVVPLRHEKRF